MRSSIGLVLFLLMSFSVDAEIYKWTDKSGRVHFSDKAPDKAEDVTELAHKKNTHPPSTEDRNSLENTRQFLKTLEEERAVERKKESKREEKRKKRALYCQRLKKEMTIYDKGYAVFRFNEKGEHEYLTDEEIAGKQNRYDSLWAEYCEDL